MQPASTQQMMPTLSPQQLRLLAESGVVRYVPRTQLVLVPATLQAGVAEPLPQAHTAPALPSRPQSDASTIRQPHAAASVVASANASFGPRRLCFAGPAQLWPGLRVHLLRAFGATEVPPGGLAGTAEIMFGGRGSVLALPALGALAASPALKRQSWAALRALRRNGA